MAEIVSVDAFEDAGDDDPSAINRDEEEKTTESKLEGRWGSSGWDERKSDYESHARPEPINQRVKSLLRGSGSWRQGTQRNLPGIKDKGLLNDSFFSNAEDVLFDKDPGGYDSEESVEEVFEAIEGIYCPPLTLKEHEWYCTHVLNLHKETKSSWDELFFDLALVAAFGSLASCLTLSSESDSHHRRLSSGDVHMSFPRAVFLYCLETATVISVRRFTDGHRAQWRRNDLFGSLLLLGRAICCLGMGGAAPHGDEAVWKFHAWNALANGLGLWSVADSFLSQPIHWRTLRTEAINLIANAFVSLLFVFILHPDLGHVDIGWLGYALWAIYLPFMYCGSWMLPHSGIGPHSLSTLIVNVEYVSERFGLLVIITCGESLFAAVAILQQSDSVKKMLVACLSVYYALLIKLLYFELQSCVAKHAINVNALRSIMWTLAHLPLYISAAGAGAVLHWAATGHKWLVRERNLFLGFTCVLLLSLSIIALFHGKLHNDRGVWWTKKKARVSIRLILCAVIVLGCVWPKKDRENVWTILYVCALVTIDFMYEFYAKRALFEEHQIEDREHLTEEEIELRKLLETLTGDALNVTVPVGLKQGDSFNIKTSEGRSETITVPHGFTPGTSPRLAASNRLREVQKKLKNIGSSMADAQARAEKRERITAAKAKFAAARRKIALVRHVRPPAERVRSPTI